MKSCIPKRWFRALVKGGALLCLAALCYTVMLKADMRMPDHHGRAWVLYLGSVKTPARAVPHRGGSNTLPGNESLWSTRHLRNVSTETHIKMVPVLTRSPKRGRLSYSHKRDGHNSSTELPSGHSQSMNGTGQEVLTPEMTRTVFTLTRDLGVKVWDGRQFPTRYRYCFSNASKPCKEGITFDESLVKRYGIDEVASTLVAFTPLGNDTKKVNDSVHAFRLNVPLMTGASSNHYSESITALESLQKYVTPFKVIYWDLGLTTNQRRDLRKICGLELRKWNYTGYPAHVRNLQTFAWKPLLVLEMLKKHPGVMWFDSSVRFQYKEFWRVAHDTTRRTGGVIHYSGGHIYPSLFTHPHLYDYLPTDTEKFGQVTEAGEGGLILYVKTRRTFENVLYWYWLCALTADCIAPAKPVQSHKGKRVKGHRYDQSVLGILNENLYDFDLWGYLPVNPYQLKVERTGGKPWTMVKWQCLV